MNWIDPVSLYLAIGGLVGGAVRAACGTQVTYSKRSLLDLVLGIAMAILLPLFKIFPDLSTAHPAQLLAMGFIIGVFGSYFLAWGLWRLGICKGDVRANKPTEL
jgi:hypothetical protein